MKVIVRDDDISYFTQPELLQQLYDPLWTHGLPVCLSVIPYHYDSVKVTYRSGVAEPDENTPISQFGQGLSHPISNNPHLTNFLSNLDCQELAELCVHGFEHRYREFHVDAHKAQELLDSSLEIFAASFPSVKPKTFVPPYESLSSEALTVLNAHKLNVATDAETAVDLHLACAGGKEEPIFAGGDDSLVFAGASYVFDPLKNDSQVEIGIEATLNSSPNLLIITNHYWDFFENFVTPKRHRIDLWTNFVNTLISRGAIFTTFRKEAQWFHRSCH